MTNNDELSIKSESIIADMKRRHEDIQIYAPIMTWSEFESLLAERDADKKRIAELEGANASQDDHINQQQDRIDALEQRNSELGKYAGKLESISTAAEKLVRCKGRYHSEQNYRALAALFGVKTPDLPPLELEAGNLSRSAVDVLAERRRQVTAEGWTPEHDNTHESGELAGAAACYARHVNGRQWVYRTRPESYASEAAPNEWPWDERWWKPKSPRSDLVRAAALILAEIERLDRAAGIKLEVGE